MPRRTHRPLATMPSTVRPTFSVASIAGAAKIAAMDWPARASPPATMWLVIARRGRRPHRPPEPSPRSWPGTRSTVWTIAAGFACLVVLEPT